MKPTSDADETSLGNARVDVRQNVRDSAADA
jgi:hypothetical protein